MSEITAHIPTSGLDVTRHDDTRRFRRRGVGIVFALASAAGLTAACGSNGPDTTTVALPEVNPSNPAATAEPVPGAEQAENADSKNINQTDTEVNPAGDVSIIELWNEWKTSPGGVAAECEPIELTPNADGTLDVKVTISNHAENASNNLIAGVATHLISDSDQRFRLAPVLDGEATITVSAAEKDGLYNDPNNNISVHVIVVPPNITVDDLLSRMPEQGHFDDFPDLGRDSEDVLHKVGNFSGVMTWALRFDDPEFYDDTSDENSKFPITVCDIQYPGAGN